MRPPVTLLGLLCLLAMIAPSKAHAQWVSDSIPQGLNASPRSVLNQFLFRRHRVTRNRPVLEMCGPEAVAMMTPAAIASLTRTDNGYVDSVAVLSTCPIGKSYDMGMPLPWGEQIASLATNDRLMIVQMTFGPLKSSIDALFAPRTGGLGWREHFEWDHRRLADMKLTFTDFQVAVD